LGRVEDLTAENIEVAGKHTTTPVLDGRGVNIRGKGNEDVQRP